MYVCTLTLILDILVIQFTHLRFLTIGLEVLGANTNDSDEEQIWDAPVSEAFFKDDDDASQCL
jgi:hypothetical protein